jgi:Rrf2 family protein
LAQIVVASGRPRGIAVAPAARYARAVKLSVKSDYAARAVLALAHRYQRQAACRVEDLAAEQGIPANYLVQILIELKSKQIVTSRRGKEGGYLLARPPAEISLGDILRAVHGQVFDTPALADGRTPPELRAAWLKLQRTLEETADAVTFQDLVDHAAERAKMYYI